MSTIDILLATYNSFPYLEEMIGSIHQQDFTDWHLLVRDGGSDDSTLDILEKYSSQYPERIILLPSSGRSDVRENFSRLLLSSAAPYMMFCDHDDVWLANKISKTMTAMKRAEKQYGSDSPLLVFTDMHVVNESLKNVSDSCFDYQNIDPKQVGFNRLLLQNVPSGCTMMLNRALADICTPIPPEAVMHDHWVSLTAAAFGKIVYLDERTLLYRQHESNIYGASEYGFRYFFRRQREGMDAVRKRFVQNVDQAAAFYQRYGDSLPPKYREMVYDFSRWRELSWFERRKVLLKHRIFKTGFRRNLGMFLVI